MLSRLFLLAMALAALPVSGSASPFPVPYPVLGQRQVAPPQFPNAERLSPITIRIPFKLAGHLIVIQAEVAGQSGNFILDTGSSKLILNARHYSGGQAAPNTVGISMTGAINDLREATVRDFTIDSLQYGRLHADVIDLNSIYEIKRETQFRLSGFEDAEEVRLAGSFTDWENRALRMHREGKAWVVSLPLTGGKHLYKFIVDGEWITDPANPIKEYDWGAISIRSEWWNKAGLVACSPFRLPLR